MRCFYNGTGFTVSYNDFDSDDFDTRWPGSTVCGKGSFSFDSSGDLRGSTGSAEDQNGNDWAAFAEDCKKYGMPHYKKRVKREARRKAKFDKVPQAVKNMMGVK